MKIVWAIAWIMAISICTGCIQTTPDVVKIGLVAPFEGRYREIGYDVIPAARLAVREWAAKNPDTHLVFEIVAYDDGGDPQSAVEQAQRLVTDPQVAIVLGHWRESTTAAALPTYAEAGRPVFTFTMAELTHQPGVVNLSPDEANYREAVEEWASAEGISVSLLLDCSANLTETVGQLDSFAEADQGSLVVGGPCWGLGQFYALAGGKAEGLYFISGAADAGDMIGDEWTVDQAANFVEGYQEGSLGAPPGMLAVQAFQGTWLAMAQIANERGIKGFNSPISNLTFGEDGRLMNAPIYLYVWKDGGRELVARLR